MCWLQRWSAWAFTCMPLTFWITSLQVLSFHGPALELMKADQRLTSLCCHLLCERVAEDKVVGKAACMLTCLYDKEESFLVRIISVSTLHSKKVMCFPMFAMQTWGCLVINVLG